MSIHVLEKQLLGPIKAFLEEVEPEENAKYTYYFPQKTISLEIVHKIRVKKDYKTTYQDVKQGFDREKSARVDRLPTGCYICTTRVQYPLPFSNDKLISCVFQYFIPNPEQDPIEEGSMIHQKSKYAAKLETLLQKKYETLSSLPKQAVFATAATAIESSPQENGQEQSLDIGISPYIEKLFDMSKLRSRFASWTEQLFPTANKVEEKESKPDEKPLPCYSPRMALKCSKLPSSKEVSRKYNTRKDVWKGFKEFVKLIEDNQNAHFNCQCILEEGAENISVTIEHDNMQDEFYDWIENSEILLEKDFIVKEIIEETLCFSSVTCCYRVLATPFNPHPVMGEKFKKILKDKYGKISSRKTKVIPRDSSIVPEENEPSLFKPSKHAIQRTIYTKVYNDEYELLEGIYDFFCKLPLNSKGKFASSITIDGKEESMSIKILYPMIFEENDPYALVETSLLHQPLSSNIMQKKSLKSTLKGNLVTCTYRVPVSCMGHQSQLVEKIEEFFLEKYEGIKQKRVPILGAIDSFARKFLLKEIPEEDMSCIELDKAPFGAYD